MEKNTLESARDNGGCSTSQPSLPLASTGVNPSKGKSKGVFATFDQSDPESDGKQTTGAHTAAGHSEWIKPGSRYKFPCPLQNHDHKIASCTEFFTLTPKDRWFKISKGRICYTCLKPKGPSIFHQKIRISGNNNCQNWSTFLDYQFQEYASLTTRIHSQELG